MESFPDDIILHIFSFLKKKTLCLGARLTCVRWWNISKDGSLWKNLTVPVYFTDTRVQLLFDQFGHFIEELDCSPCEALTSQIFLNLKNNDATDSGFPDIKRLALPIEPLDSVPYDKIDEYFLKLSKIFPNLENLENVSSVSGMVNVLEVQCNFPYLTVLNDKPTASFGRISEVIKRGVQEKKDLWFKNMKKVAESCPKITEYRCTKGSGYIDHGGLHHIGSLFPCLDILELRLCLLNDDALADFYSVSKDTRLSKENNRCLRNNYKGISEFIFEKPGKITDKGLEIIANNSPDLKKMKLSRCSEITQNGLRDFTSKCKGLTSLHINTSRGWGSDTDLPVEQIDDDCLDVLSENCKHLQIFRILYSTKISFKSVVSLRENCINMSSLMFFDCPKINDNALEEMAKMPFLKKLVLVSTSVSAKGIMYFILDCPFLTSLTLYCGADSDFGTDMCNLGEEIYEKIDAVSSKYRPNAITSLTLRGVGSGFLQLITVLSPNLVSLDIRDGYATSISTNSLKSVLINCEGLEQLDISSLTKVHPSFLTAMVESAKSLQKLSLGSNVKSYENKDFYGILTSCPCLEMIAMDTYGSSIDEIGLVEFITISHGGCYLHLDKECEKDVDFKHRFIDLHFLPCVYVASVTTRT